MVCSQLYRGHSSRVSELMSTGKKVPTGRLGSAKNAFCIPACAPIKTRQLQGVSNDRTDRIPIPYVKEEEALAEDLRLVVRLDAQSLSRVERSETFLQFAKDILVHGITSPKSARPSN
jgi:hypothetical protein